MQFKISPITISLKYNYYQQNNCTSQSWYLPNGTHPRYDPDVSLPENLIFPIEPGC